MAERSCFLSCSLKYRKGTSTLSRLSPFVDYVDHQMKRTTLEYSSQDHSPLHPFMLSRVEGPNFTKKLTMGWCKGLFQTSHQEKIAEQTWFRSSS